MKFDRTKRRRFLAFLAAFAVMVSLVPATALAGGPAVINFITVTVNPAEKTYDGTPLVPTFTFSPMPADIVSAKLVLNPGKPSGITKPGVLDVTQDFMWGHEAYDASGYNVAMDQDHTRFPLAYFVSGKLTVNPRAVTLTVDDQTMAAGGAIPTLTAKVTGGSFLPGDEPKWDLAVVGDTSKPGTCSIQATYAETETLRDCYAITVEKGDLTVTEPDSGGEAEAPPVTETKFKIVCRQKEYVGQPWKNLVILNGSTTDPNRLATVNAPTAAEVKELKGLNLIGPAKQTVTVKADGTSEIVFEYAVAAKYRVIYRTLEDPEANRWGAPYLNFTEPGDFIAANAGDKITPPDAPLTWDYFGDAYYLDGDASRSFTLTEGSNDLIYLYKRGVAEPPIVKRAVTLTVDDKTMTAGGVRPELTAQVTSGSFLPGDEPDWNLSVADFYANVPGEYTINAAYKSTDELETYYDITVMPGTLTVTELPIVKRAVTLTVDDKTMTAGGVRPDLTAQVTSGSFLPGDEPDWNLSVAGFYANVPGEYAINAAYESTDELRTYYDITVIPGTLTVTAPTGSGGGGGTVAVPPAGGTPDAPVVIVPVAAVPAPAAAVTPIAETVTPAAPAPDAEPTQIEEAEVPMAAADTTNISDSGTPLAAQPAQPVWALWNLILAIVTGGIMAVLLIGYFTGKKRKARGEERESLKRMGVARLLSVAVTLVAVIVFLLTEDMSAQMVMTDQWTVWMAGIAIAQAAVAFFSKKRKQHDEPMQAQPANG